MGTDRSRSVWFRVRTALPAVLMMVLIFVGSTDLLSTRHTSRFLGPLLHWLVPGISNPAVAAIQLGLRKLGHATEYGVLALLLWRAINAPDLGRNRPWPSARAFWTWSLATAYACTDEWHQTFVASRQGQWTDVLIDSVGAAMALGILWWVGQRRRRWRTAAGAI